MTKDGQVYGCGDTYYIENSVDNDVHIPQHIYKLSQYNIKQVSCGFYTSLFLSASGQVFIATLFTIQPVKVVDPIYSIACGDNCWFLVSETGAVYAFGSPAYGQTIFAEEKRVPEKITAFHTPIKNVACGNNFTLFLVGRIELTSKIYLFDGHFADIEFYF